MNILDKFNFSYSTYDTYCKSPLWFYYMKIAKSKISDDGIQVYGDAGNVVHNAAEDWWTKKEIAFEDHWEKYRIDNQFGINGSKLNKADYNKMYMNLCRYMDKIDWDKSKAELEINKKELDMNFKGFIDLYTEKGENIIIYDWKTNSKHTAATHKKQRLIYSYLIWSIRGITPICRWIYLKNMDESKENWLVEERYTEKELLDFEQELIKFREEILEKGENINNYPAGNWKNPFNKYFSLCSEEVQRRENSEEIEVHMAIKGNFIFFENEINPKLHEGIDFETKFDLPDKYWAQQQVKKKMIERKAIQLGKPEKSLTEAEKISAINYKIIEDVGTTHLYNKKFKCFPVGLLDTVTKNINDYASFYKKQVKIFLHDRRNKEVMEKVNNIMPDKLCSGKILRDYQVDACQKFLKKNSGIIAIATGGGKTLIASEIIRKADTNTLWLIDRKELLDQTKKTLETELGIKIGKISEGVVDIKPVTIATIQSVHSKLNELQDYLYNINFVIVDEYHKSAAETYQKVFAKLPNTKYRLGLTATPTRDDGKSPILFSILGEVVCKVSTRDLIDMGYLVKPTIKFVKINQMDIFLKTYVEDYKNNVVECEERNGFIGRFSMINSTKKILILTKQVNHGKTLQKMIYGSEHIHGKSKDREQIMQNFRTGKTNVLIMTLSIGAEGLDIPDLDIIINAAANKGDVKSIQVLGRVLRLFTNKSSAVYYDFVDAGKYTSEHSAARIRAFENEGHKVEIK